MILPLRRLAPVALRVGFNSHIRLAEALTGHECQGAEAPVDLVVIESRWVERHRRLAELAAGKQRLLVDPRIDHLALKPSGQDPAGWLASPHRLREVVESSLDAQRQSVATFAPAFHVDRVGDAWWKVNQRLLDETADLAGRQPAARLIGTPEAFGTPQAAHEVITALSRRGVTELIATIGPVNTGEDASRLLCLVRELARAELSVHVSHTGTLGLAALVVGARSFDSGELGSLQSYDFVSRRRRVGSQVWVRPPLPRAYIAPLLTSLPVEMVARILQLRAARGTLECAGPCCAYRMDGTTLYPVTHFLHNWFAQLRAVLDRPVEMRPGQVQVLYRQAIDLLDTIKGIRTGGLAAAELRQLRERTAHVRLVSQRMETVLATESWSA